MFPGGCFVDDPLGDEDVEGGQVDCNPGKEEYPGIVDVTSVISRHYGDLPLKVGQQSAQTVMGVDQVRMPFPYLPPQIRESLQISSYALPGHREDVALDSLTFDSGDLLHDERSISAIPVASDKKNFHLQEESEQGAAADLEERPSDFHEKHYDTPCRKGFVRRFS